MLFMPPYCAFSLSHSYHGLHICSVSCCLSHSTISKSFSHILSLCLSLILPHHDLNSCYWSLPTLLAPSPLYLYLLTSLLSSRSLILIIAWMSPWVRHTSQTSCHRNDYTDQRGHHHRTTRYTAKSMLCYFMLYHIAHYWINVHTTIS